MSEPQVLPYASPTARAPWHRATILTFLWAVLTTPISFGLLWLSGRNVLPQHLFCCDAPALGLLLFVGSPVGASLIAIRQMFRARSEIGGGRNLGVAVATFVIALLSACFGFMLSQAIKM